MKGVKFDDCVVSFDGERGEFCRNLGCRLLAFGNFFRGWASLSGLRRLLVFQ